MPEAPRYSVDGARQDTFALPADVFDGVVNEAVLHRAVVTYLANQRQGTHATKTRQAVSGSGRKPWRQKGTGRARQGSMQAPHWRGGGVAFGPTPRDHRIELPRVARRLARKSALNARAREAAVHVIERFAAEVPKTRAMAALLEKIGIAGERVLLLTASHSENVWLSARNIPGVAVRPFAQATAYEILRARHLVIEQEALVGESSDTDVQAEAAEPGDQAAKPTARSRAKSKTSVRKTATTKKATKGRGATAKKSAGRKTATTTKTGSSKTPATRAGRKES
jgi:large subunit ribosomal protein L4